MLRSILGGIAGYLVCFICMFLFFTGLFFALGPDGAFLPGVYRLTMVWTISAFAISFVTAAIGGYVASMIGSGGGVKVLAGIILIMGIMGILMVLNLGPEEVRSGAVSNFEAMGKARDSVWAAIVNPICAIVGAFFGGSMRKAK